MAARAVAAPRGRAIPLVSSLFQPIRTRLQRIVDRRFDRPRIGAERTLQRHGELLAHVVELEVIERDVLETVAETVRPVAASLWIRPSRAAGRAVRPAVHPSGDRRPLATYRPLTQACRPRTIAAR